MASTSSSKANAFNIYDKSNTAIYSNRNGQVSFVASELPAVCNQDWIPAVDNTYSLGENSTPRRWKNLFLAGAATTGSLSSGSITVTGNALLATDGTHTVQVGLGGLKPYAGNPNVGTSSSYMGTGYFQNLNVSNTVTTQNLITGSLVVTTETPSVFGGTIRPGTDNKYDIGTPTFEWKDLYITGNVYKGGAVYNPGLSSLGDLLPAADNTYIVGKIGGPRWKSGDFYGNIHTVTGTILTDNGNVEASNGSVWAGNGTVTGSTVTGNQLTVLNYAAPTIDNNADCGLSNKRWRSLWAMTGTFATSVTAANIYPTAVDSGTIGSVAGGGFATTYCKQSYVNQLLPYYSGGATMVGTSVSGQRFNEMHTQDIDSSGTHYRNFTQTSGATFYTGPDNVTYNDVCYARGIIDGTVYSGGVPSKASFDVQSNAFANVVQFSSDFAVGISVSRLSPGKYNILIASKFDATGEALRPDYRGLPRNGSAYNGGATNPRAMPYISVTPYWTHQWKSWNGLPDNTISMCVRDVYVVGDATIPNGDTSTGNPIASISFTVQTSNGYDTLFAFECKSAIHGPWVGTSTAQSAVWNKATDSSGSTLLFLPGTAAAAGVGTSAAVVAVAAVLQILQFGVWI